MHILQILSQIELTGAESYALTLSEWLIKNNHQVTIISDKIHSQTTARFIPRPIHTKGFINRIKNIYFLRKYIIEQQVQIVHAHSRASVRVAYWATKFCSNKVALVSTIHGRQHFSLSKKLFDNYGDRVIAVCENIKNHLITDFHMNKRKIYTLGNPIRMDNLDSTSEQSSIQSESLKIAVVGRFSGPKGENTKALLEKVIPEIVAKNQNIEFHILGMNPPLLGEQILNSVAELNKVIGNRIKIYEVEPGKLDSLLKKFHLVLGAGRIAISSLIQGVPTIAIGEADYHGFVQQDNLQKVLASNFGDIAADKNSTQLFLNKNNELVHQIKNDISKAIHNIDTYRPTLELINSIKQKFDLNLVCTEIFNHYQSALFTKHFPNPIPVLMYHKIPDHELVTPHRIFVTRENFNKHLQFFSEHKFTTLSFNELDEYRTGKKSFSEFPIKPLIITFDDGYVNNLTNAVPLLKKYNFKATFFLLANKDIDTNAWDKESGAPQLPLMNQEQRKHLLNSGMEIGSHGFNHKKITRMSDSEAMSELFESKNQLESELNIKIKTFAFTYGDTSEKHAVMAKEAGYRFAVNTDTGGLHIEEDPYSIFRISIFPEETKFSLWKKTSKWYRKYYYWKRHK